MLRRFAVLRWPLRAALIGALTFTAAVIGGLANPIIGGLAAAAVAVVSLVASERESRAVQGRLDELEKPLTYNGQRLQDEERRRRDVSARISAGDREG